MFPTAHLPSAYTHRSDASNTHGTSTAPNKDPVNGAGEPHPGVHLLQRRDDLYLKVNSSVQHLLNLTSPFVRLGDKRLEAFGPPGPNADIVPFDYHIRPEHKVYLTRSNEQLLRLFFDAVLAFDKTTQDPKQVFPYTKLRDDMVSTLRNHPDRQHDGDELSKACSSIEYFLFDYRDILAQTLDRRPELRSAIEYVGNEMLENAVKSATAGRNTYEDLITSDEMLARAETRTREDLDNQAKIRQREITQASRDFYARANAVDGAGPAPSLRDLKRLASGQIFYPDLQTLLAYAPQGRVVSQFVQRQNPKISDLKTPFFPKNHTEVAYGGGLVRHLHYWENRAAGRHVRVLVTPDGYRITDSGGLKRFPQQVSAEARRANLVQLESMVLAAQDKRRRKP